ncbi:MAG: RNA-binding protein [Clostridiales bacterium]|jgi:RNA-binding protein YlmH|nr:RNA-binding protein [Clostridiales bacterium]
MYNKQKLLAHITDKDERLALSKLLDCAQSAEKKGQAFSGFYYPAVISKFIDIIRHSHRYIIYGGYQDAERVMAGFYSFNEINENMFPISALKISYNNKFTKSLTHRDFLGSALALQIDRSKIGDILIFPDYAIMLAHAEISGFIISSLEKVKNATVSVELLEGSFEPPANTNTAEKKYTVASLRLDTVISQVFNMSRAKSAEYIASEKVFINWALTTSTSKQVCGGDIITVRGMGRIKLLEVMGKTKKDRESIKARLY